MGALDLFHQIYSMTSVFPFLCGQSHSVLHGQLSLLQPFSLAQHLHPDLCPILIPMQGREAYKEQKAGEKDGEVFIVRAILCHCKGFLKLLLWYLFQPSNPDWVYDFFLISVYRVNMGTWFNMEQRRTSVLLLEKP